MLMLRRSALVDCARSGGRKAKRDKPRASLLGDFPCVRGVKDEVRARWINLQKLFESRRGELLRSYALLQHDICSRTDGGVASRLGGRPRRREQIERASSAFLQSCPVRRCSDHVDLALTSRRGDDFSFPVRWQDQPDLVALLLPNSHRSTEEDRRGDEVEHSDVDGLVKKHWRRRR